MWESELGVRTSEFNISGDSTPSSLPVKPRPASPRKTLSVAPAPTRGLLLPSAYCPLSTVYCPPLLPVGLLMAAATAVPLDAGRTLEAILGPPPRTCFGVAVSAVPGAVRGYAPGYGHKVRRPGLGCACNALTYREIRERIRAKPRRPRPCSDRTYVFLFPPETSGHRAGQRVKCFPAERPMPGSALTRSGSLPRCSYCPLPAPYS